MTTISVCQWEDGDSWNRYLDRTAEASVYQRFEWRDLYRDVFRLPAHYLGVKRGHDLAGVLPLVQLRAIRGERMLVSLPYVNYAGMLADDTQCATSLWGEAARLAGVARCRWIELREKGSTPHVANTDVSRHKVREILPLPDDSDLLWGNYPAKLRSQIKRAWKNGLKERIGGRELVPDFYDVYLRNMRFLGSPPLPQAFFEWIADRSGASVSTCCVMDGRVPVAASFMVASGTTLEVPWAASRPQSRASSANMLLYWAMIRHAVESGHRIFDMGRSTPGSGSHRFKTQWGGISQPLEWRYWRRDDCPLPGYTHGDGQFALARRVWRFLPLGVTRSLGGRLIRHIPS